MLSDFNYRLSNTIYFSRVFAIISVITAHCRIESYQYVVNVFSNIGTVGVGFFFFCSGLYFNTMTSKKKHLVRLFHLFIPWVVGSSIIWFEVNLRHHDFSVLSWLKHFFGVGSIFYFFTVYFIFIIFSMLCFSYLNKWFKNNFAVILFFLSLLLSVLFCFFENKGISFFFTPYLNPFIFLPYYLLGLFFNYKKKYLDFLLNSPVLSFCPIILLFVFIPIHLSYWNVLYIFLELFFILALVRLSYFIVIHITNDRYLTVFLELGKNSLFIYIYHLIPLSVINYFGQFSTMFKHIFVIWPIAVIFIFFLFLCVIKRLRFSSFYILFGVR